MLSRHLRASLVIALLVVACGSGDNDDEGCGPHLNDASCTTDQDCAGYTGPPLSDLVLRQKDPRCVVARCEANECVASSFPTGALEDEVHGDCHKPTCDGNGYLTDVVDLTDTGKSLPCHEITCGPPLIERLANDGTSCWRSETYEEGICRSGACVPIDRDAGNDAGDDAGDDINDDAGNDASLDGSDGAADAATD